MFSTIGSNCRCCDMMENDQSNLIYLKITANQLASALAQATAAATGENVNVTIEDIYYVALCITHYKRFS